MRVVSAEGQRSLAQFCKERSGIIPTRCDLERFLLSDFDIDYNQMKYLIETRLCGALTKPKSALVVKSRVSTDVLIVPTVPTFNPVTGDLTIVNTANVVYTRTDNDAVVNAAGSPYVIAAGDSLTIQATAGAGFYFATSEDDSWTFTADAA